MDLKDSSSRAVSSPSRLRTCCEGIFVSPEGAYAIELVRDADASVVLRCAIS